jgi:hypothetical protein
MLTYIFASLALASAPAKADPPWTQTDLRALGSHLREAAAAFDRGRDENRLLTKDAIRRINDWATAASTMGDEASAWVRTLSSQSKREWWKCTAGLRGSPGLLAISLKYDPFGGGTAAPKEVYPGFADEARLAATYADRFAQCLPLALDTEKMVASANEAARARAAAAADAAERQKAEDELRAMREREDRSRDEQAATLREKEQAEVQESERLRRSLQLDLRERAQRGQDAAARSNASQEEIRAAVTQFALQAGQNEGDVKFDGGTWHMNIAAGLSAYTVPIYTNVVGGAGTNGNRYSQPTDAGSIGGGVLFELWPYFGTYAGIGGSAQIDEGAFTVSAGTNSSATIVSNYKGKAYFGARKLALIGEYALIDRYASSSMDLAAFGTNATGSGDASYTVKRAGGGLRFGAAGHGALEVLSYQDKLSFKPGASPAPVYAARLVLDYIVLQYEQGSKYPIAGTPQYSTAGEATSGSYSAISLSFGWRMFGKPYVDRTRRGALSGID